jgi:hypothetical protein
MMQSSYSFKQGRGRGSLKTVYYFENLLFRNYCNYSVMSLQDEDAAKQDYWPPRSKAKARSFDWSVPTNIAYDIHQHNRFTFTTAFQDARGRLDYDYHKNPRLERQVYQDSVLDRILSSVVGTQQRNKNVQPSIVFTVRASDCFETAIMAHDSCLGGWVESVSQSSHV